MKAQCLSDKRIPSALTLRLLRLGSATRRKRQAGCLLFDPTNRFFPAQNGPAVTSDAVAITARSASLPHHMACACNSLRRGSCDVADLGAAASGFSKSSRYDPDGVRAFGRTVIRVDLAASRLFPVYPRQPTWRQVLRRLQVSFCASVSGGKNPVPNSKRVGMGDRSGCCKRAAVAQTHQPAGNARSYC